MKIVSTNVFVGPSTYAHFPVIRHVLDLGVLEEWPTSKLGDAFVDPLLEFLPGLHEHPWAHLDIAGVAWSKKDRSLVPKGGSGFGVRLLDRLLSNHYEERS